MTSWRKSPALGHIVIDELSKRPLKVVGDQSVCFGRQSPGRQRLTRFRATVSSSPLRPHQKAQWERLRAMMHLQYSIPSSRQ